MIPLLDNLSNKLVLENAEPGVKTPPFTGIESLSSNKVIAQLIIILEVDIYPGSYKEKKKLQVKI